MANNQSTMCAGLPKGLWWLLTLLGLGLLYFLMLSNRQGPIEADLTKRTAAGLAGENIDWAKVELDRRGRDVLLTGAAPSTDARDAALRIAKDVSGVRVVQHNIDIAQPLSSPHLDIQENEGRVTLSGQLASQQAIDEVVAAANAAYGADHVTNNLTVSDQVGKAAWLSAAIGLVPGIASVNAAHFSVSDTETHLTGEADSGDMKASLLDRAKAAFSNLKSEVVVAVAPEPEPVVEPMPEPEPVDNHVAVCQAKLDSTMVGKKILFAFDKAEVHDDSYGLLKQIASVLDECKDIVTASGLTISGHTDSRGDDAYNQGLSDRRAAAVKAYLATAGVDIGLMSSIGHGESQPVASNDTAEGMAQNRRIDFTIKHQ